MVKIDKEKCIGCGLCSELCGKSFEMQGDKAAVKKTGVNNAAAEEEAANNCPVEAITLD